MGSLKCFSQSIVRSVVTKKGLEGLVWNGLDHLFHRWLAISSGDRVGRATQSVLLWQASCSHGGSRLPREQSEADIKQAWLCSHT